MQQRLWSYSIGAHQRDPDANVYELPPGADYDGPEVLNPPGRSFRR